MKRCIPIALLAACGPADPTPVAPDPTAAVSQAAPEARPERPEFPGVVTSRNSRLITAEFEGNILELAIRSRKRVKQGELVATLDGSKLESELAALKQEMAGIRGDAGAAGASCRASRARVRTQQRLYDKGFASRNSLRDAQADASRDCSTAGAVGSKASAFKPRIKQLEEQLAKAKLTAPIDGVVTMLKTRDGEAAAKGTPIARVYDDSDLVIRFAVDKEHVHLVKEGDRVELAVEGHERPIWASVETITPEEAPLDFVTVLADIDDKRLESDEVRVASEGRVRIAEAQGAKR